MVKDFVFIEEGSLKQEDLKKLFTISGMTDTNVIRYKQGSTKPELVHIDITGKEIEKEDIQDFVKKAEQQARVDILTALEEYLDNTAEKKSESYFDNYECRFKLHYTTTIDGTIDEFMTKFKAFLETKYDKQ